MRVQLDDDVDLHNADVDELLEELRHRIETNRQPVRYRYYCAGRVQWFACCRSSSYVLGEKSEESIRWQTTRSLLRFRGCDVHRARASECEGAVRPFCVRHDRTGGACVFRRLQVVCHLLHRWSNHQRHYHGVQRKQDRAETGENRI